MSQEAMGEDVMTEMTQEEVRGKGEWVVGSVGSDEHETKTQENPHPHPMRIQENLATEPRTL